MTGQVKRRWGSATLAALLLAAAMPAQAPKKMDFDVVMVKPNKSGSNSTRMSARNLSLTATNVSLQMLVAAAYDIRKELISGGPEWVSEDRWDLQAKVSQPDVELLKTMTPGQWRAMMQDALEKSFKLQVHTEVKTLPVYELTVVKPGLLKSSGVQEVTESSPKKAGMGAGSTISSGGTLTVYSVTMDSICKTLSSMTERTVVDRTGLKGRFDFDLKFAPDDMEMSANGSGAADAAPLFEAIQEQLGLKLVPAKGPVTTMVVDHAERPAEN